MLGQIVPDRFPCQGTLGRCLGDRQDESSLSQMLAGPGVLKRGKDPHNTMLGLIAISAPAIMVAFESDYETVLTVTARRDRLDKQITAMAADSEFTPIVHRLGCLRGVATLTAFALAVEIGTGTGSPATASAHSSAWCRPRTPPAPRGSKARSPRPARPRPPATRRSRLASPTPLPARQNHARPVGAGPPAA